ncbi:hypothetical protein V2I01_29670 [Micromonospora sp. BRA006-A]|nr:hypothetical protein [Micromonospora sp. BRA006-A]
MGRDKHGDGGRYPGLDEQAILNSAGMRRSRRSTTRRCYRLSRVCASR